MLATGTGVGPFLSMLQTAEPGSALTRLCSTATASSRESRVPRSDQRLQREHPRAFPEFVSFVTGEPAEDAFACRIPETLADGRLERRVGLTLDPARSHVMLLRHSEMISDAVGVLGNAGYSATGVVNRGISAPRNITRRPAPAQCRPGKWSANRSIHSSAACSLVRRRPSSRSTCRR